MKNKVQIGVKFGDFFSHENQIMPSIGWLIYFGTPLIKKNDRVEYEGVEHFNPSWENKISW